jgi:hypothetical protein
MDNQLVNDMLRDLGKEFSMLLHYISETEDQTVLPHFLQLNEVITEMLKYKKLCQNLDVPKIQSIRSRANRTYL